MNRKLSLVVTVAFLVALSALPLTAASGIAASGWAVPDSPEARAELWSSSFQKYLDGQVNLTPQQRDVLEKAMNSASPELFADNPGPRQRTEIARILLTVKKSLYCTKYADLFNRLEGLADWLRGNQVVAKDEGVACNCGSGGCGSGYSCKSSGCYAEPGTTNYGRCEPNPPDGGGGEEEILQ